MQNYWKKVGRKLKYLRVILNDSYVWNCNYLLTKDLQEPAAEIQMAAELIDAYVLDKRFMRELENEEYDAA